MGQKKTYKFQGHDVMGEEVEFETEKESWNVYILHDGTRMKYKSVVGAIIRLDAYKEDGEPVYMINASNLAVADVPEALKRTPKG